MGDVIGYVVVDDILLDDPEAAEFCSPYGIVWPTADEARREISENNLVPDGWTVIGLHEPGTVPDELTVGYVIAGWETVGEELESWDAEIYPTAAAAEGCRGTNDWAVFGLHRVEA